MKEEEGAVDDALTQLLDYTGQLAEARRLDPRDDLITRIAQAGREDGWTRFGCRFASKNLL